MNFFESVFERLWLQAATATERAAYSALGGGEGSSIIEYSIESARTAETLVVGRACVEQSGPEGPAAASWSQVWALWAAGRGWQSLHPAALSGSEASWRVHFKRAQDDACACPDSASRACSRREKVSKFASAIVHSNICYATGEFNKDLIGISLRLPSTKRVDCHR